MTNSRIDNLASLLIRARTDRVAIESVPDELIPQSVEEANAVDDRIAELSGWPVAGWKIGCTSEHAQTMLGTDGPFAGRIYSVVHCDRDEPVRLGPEIFVTPKLEGEFAFTFASALPPSASGHSRSEVLATVGGVRPAMELVGGRFTDFVGLPLHLLIADSGSNCLLVVGDAVPVGPKDRETLAERLRSASATMTVNGEQTGAGTGDDVLGGPVEALMWLVDHLSKRGIGIEAGQTVTTGTATQVSGLAPGASATLRIEGVGTAEVNREP